MKSAMVTGVTAAMLCASPFVSTANAAPAKATVDLQPKSGSTVSGTIHIEEAGADAATLTGEIKGLTPGKHGFHFHDKNDCSAADASSAGGHFNPTNAQHGAPDATAHHMGDLGNIEADANGIAHLNIHQSGVVLHGANSVLGHSVIVHKGVDDLTTQPSGNSGDRVACGVVTATN